MISVENLKVEFGGFTLFEDISFYLNDKERIALAGRNGAGKSTMLKIIAGKQVPSGGQISSPKGTTIGYLPQQMVVNNDKTVFEEASLAFERIHKMQKELDEVNQKLVERTDYESDGYTKLIERTVQLNEQLHMHGGNSFHGEVEKTLLGLGFVREDLDRPTTEFSGGWRMRIELAKILLQQPDVLLLDEPTNHLDIESIQWLEHFLATRANAVVLVSHDRAFLDAVTNRTIEISLGRIYDFKASYSKYLVLREELREQQLRAYENQQREIQKTEEFIDRFRAKASKAVQVQSRIKQLDKLDIVEVDDVDTRQLNLKFQPAPRSGNYPLIVEDLAKTYGKQLVFKDAKFTVERGDKIAFVGKNGAGKTTMVKCIMDQIDYDGTLKIGHNVRIGYFAQNQAQLLDEDKTVFETIDDVAVGDIRTKVRNILGSFMFRGEDSDKKVKVLSGGERSRLAMIKLLLEPVNLLILDEPTNHLDIQSKDVLKEALKDFEGTIILVSHDRDFLNGLVDKVYEFGDQKVVEHLGGIYDFLERKKLSTLTELEKSPTVTQSATSQDAKNEKVAPGEEVDNELDYEERREVNRQINRAIRQVENLEKEIEKKELEKEKLEQKLSIPEHAADNKLFEEHAKIEKRISEAMKEWEIANKEVDQLSKKV